MGPLSVPVVATLTAPKSKPPAAVVGAVLVVPKLKPLEPLSVPVGFVVVSPKVNVDSALSPKLKPPPDEEEAVSVLFPPKLKADALPAGFETVVSAAGWELVGNEKSDDRDDDDVNDENPPDEEESPKEKAGCAFSSSLGLDVAVDSASFGGFSVEGAVEGAPNSKVEDPKEKPEVLFGSSVFLSSVEGAAVVVSLGSENALLSKVNAEGFVVLSFDLLSSDEANSFAEEFWTVAFQKSSAGDFFKLSSLSPETPPNEKLKAAGAGAADSESDLDLLCFGF